jgi:hypothetical protein
MIKYQAESVIEAWPELRELCEANHQEVNLFNEPLEINTGAMSDMNADGALRLFTMRKDGSLVGYCAFFLYFHLHHIRLLVANQDVIYVKKECRGRATEFLRFCDLELKKLKVNLVFQHSPAIKDWSAVLIRNGYRELETTYYRRL